MKSHNGLMLEPQLITSSFLKLRTTVALQFFSSKRSDEHIKQRARKRNKDFKKTTKWNAKTKTITTKFKVKKVLKE